MHNEFVTMPDLKVFPMMETEYNVDSDYDIRCLLFFIASYDYATTIKNMAVTSIIKT